MSSRLNAPITSNVTIRLDLSHRYSSYNTETHELTDIHNEVIAMNDRATSVLHLLQNEFVMENRSLDDSCIFNALESVRLELEYIKRLLSHFIEEGGYRA